MPNADPKEIIDPSLIIVSLFITFALFPLITIICDPILNQRSTLRDILRVYKGKIEMSDGHDNIMIC